MRWLIFIMLMITTSGCCLFKECIIVCPSPENVPVVNQYQTDNLPVTTTSAAVIKMMLTDLMLCQDTEEQLRTILKGYEK